MIDKKVDVGDMVTPGQMLATLFDPKRMQLVASVRESLAHRLQVGQAIGVQIEDFNKQCTGTISEIVPEAESGSRAFQVKVTGPCPAGIYCGMFGRILIPLDEEQVLVIPRQAVRASASWNWSTWRERRRSADGPFVGRTIDERCGGAFRSAGGRAGRVPANTGSDAGGPHG